MLSILADKTYFPLVIFLFILFVHVGGRTSRKKTANIAASAIEFYVLQTGTKIVVALSLSLSLETPTSVQIKFNTLAL